MVFKNKIIFDRNDFVIKFGDKININMKKLCGSIGIAPVCIGKKCIGITKNILYNKDYIFADIVAYNPIECGDIENENIYCMIQIENDNTVKYISCEIDKYKV